MTRYTPRFAMRDDTTQEETRMQHYAAPFAVHLRFVGGRRCLHGPYESVTLEGGELRAHNGTGHWRVIGRWDGAVQSWVDGDCEPLVAIDIKHWLVPWERHEQLDLLALYMAGEYRKLCERYCHEGFFYGANDDGTLVEAGICSYHVHQGSEEEALAAVAAHIHQEVLQGVLGC